MPAVNWLDRRIAAPGPYLALCLSQPEFDAACRHIGVEPFDFIVGELANATMHSFTRGGRLSCIVCLGPTKGRRPVEVAGLLVHEAVHVWQAYAESMGERNPGAEQEAYAVQSIAQELMSEFARRMRRARR